MVLQRLQALLLLPVLALLRLVLVLGFLLRPVLRLQALPPERLRLPVSACP